MQAYFKKQIALPQDHGSWVFIISPLLIGAFAGKELTCNVANLSIAAMAVFLLRQPATVIVKALSGRRPKTDLAPARFWLFFYAGMALLALALLIFEGFGYLLLLAFPGIPVFAVHLWLVSRRLERKQVGIEVVATGVLSLAAPAAYWVGSGTYHTQGWWLWLLVWLQSAASIVHAYLRLGQRELSLDLWKSGKWTAAGPALLFTSSNLAATYTLGALQFIPHLIFIPYLLQWSETIWGVVRPALEWKPTRIGIRQLVVSSLWAILFIIFWRFQ